MLGQADIPLAIIYVPDEFEQAEQFRSHMRGLSNVSEIPLPADDRFASLAVLRAFGEGRVVALQGDRDFRDSGVEMPFFGAETCFPNGPFHLARMTGAILLPTFIAYAPDLRFEVVHGTPISVARTADRDGVSRIVDTLNPGAGVVTTRNDVHFVVTEYGVADLYGKTLRQRAQH